MTADFKDRTLLTLSDVKRMEDEVRRLRQDRDKIDAKVRHFENRLSAARYFMDETLFDRHEADEGGAPPQAEKSATAQPQEDRESLPDAILRTIRTAKEPPNKFAIRRALEREPVHAERFKNSPNYFYTAIKRLIDKEIIAVRNGRCYIRADQNETPSEDQSDGVSEITGEGSTSPNESLDANGIFG